MKYNTLRNAVIAPVTYVMKMETVTSNLKSN